MHRLTSIVSSVSDPGTRPGLHGRVLISTGCDALDRLFGGGLPLGTLTIVQEDGVSSNHVALLRYFVGEGMACDQVRCLTCIQSHNATQSVFLSVPLHLTAEEALGLVPLCTTTQNKVWCT